MKESILCRKRGVYFIMDAILAAILLISALALITEQPMMKENSKQIDYFSKDILRALTALKISDFNSTNRNNIVVVEEISNGNITSQDNSILEQIGEYWAKNDTIKSSRLSLEILVDIFCQWCLLH